jgi:hypothetical protein
MLTLSFRRAAAIAAVVLAAANWASAGTPVATLVPLTPTKLTVVSGAAASVQYTVTNQSAKSLTLKMTPIAGVSQITTAKGACASAFTLSPKQSCVLTLSVAASKSSASISGGPAICVNGGTTTCVQPAASAALNVTFAAPAAPANP